MRPRLIGRWLEKNNKPFVALLAAGATLAMATLIDASSSSQIEQLGLLAVPRTGHAATALADGRVLITGGRDSAGIIVATAEVVDPANETSTAIGILNTARIDHTATLLADGRVLIAGGTSVSGALTSVEIFDPSNPGAGFRVLSAIMGAARTRHTATRLHNGTVLIAGGDAAGTAEIFNPATETFSSALLAMAAPRIGHTATLFSDDSVLLAGGNTDSMEYFSSIDQTFTLDQAKLTATRTGHDAISLSDTRLLFFGGDTGYTIDEFNTSADTLSLKATMDGASSSATLLANGKILVLRPDVVGLYAPDATDQTTAFTVFDETSLPGSTALKRTGQTATELSGDKKILVAGGENAQHQPTLQIATFNPAKIWTDKDDYQPDDPVILSGSGWKANENIYLFAVDSETDQWTYESTIPADGNGEFSANPYFIVQLRQLGTQFHVTAMGAQSTLQADVHFTDTTSQVTNIGFDRTGPTSFTSGAANGALGVELLNASDSGEKLTGNTNSTVTITITSSSGTGRFDTTSGGSFSTSSLVQTITSSSPNPLNPDFPDFFYKDSAVGSVTLTATVTARGSNVANLPLNTTTTLIKQLQAATSMAVSPAAGTFGGTVTLTATLTVGGSGVNGKTIAFTLNGTSVGSATTNSSGIATLNNVSLSGINTGTYTGGIVATFTADGSGYLGSSGNATLTVSKASSTTTVTVSDAVYDGGPHGGTANVTGAGGLSQSLTVSYSGRNGTTYGPSTIPPTSAGDYTASASYAGDANHNSSNDSKNYSITKKSATWTTNDASKTYGAADPNPLTTGSGSGFVAGDNVTATYTRASGESVAGGPYHITATLSPAAALANYNVTNAGANFTITKKDAIWTTNDANKTYGDADPNPLTTGSGSGFLAADNITATYTRANGESVAGGPYHITATLGPAAAVANYNVTNNGANFTINKKDATVTADNKGKMYGDDNPTLTATVTGAVSGDTLNYSLATTAVKLSNVGDYPITVTLGSNPNYNITKTNGTLHISPKDASVTADNKNKQYGDDNPALTATVVGEVTGGDAINYTLATSALKLSGVGDYAITVTLGSNPNYNVTKTNGSLHISPKDASVTADNKNKQYGDDNPALTATVVGEVTGGDAINYTLATSALKLSGVGDYAITVTLGSNANYNVTKTNGTLHISPKDASVTADNKNKQYGDDNPALTATVVGEVTGGDAINYTLATSALKLSGVGDYAITVTLGSNPNYNVTKTNGNLHISPKDASVSADNKAKQYGDDNPALTATVLGEVAGGDAINYTLVTGALKLSGVGDYAITVTLGSNPNYNVTKTNGNLHISPKDASVSADNKAKQYGDDNPALTATVLGEVAGGDAINYTLVTGALKLSGVGDYAITVTLGSNPNYNVTKTNGNLHISPKDASVTADNKNKQYGDDNPALTATVVGEVTGGDAINYTLATSALKFSGVGDYAITVTLGSNPNYNVTKTNGNLHISPKDASVSADNKAKQYGDDNPALTATVLGEVAGGDAINYTLVTGALKLSGVGDYAITVTLGSNPNYNVTKTNGNLHISPKDASVTADDKNKQYGDDNPALTATVVGEVTGGDAINYTLATSALKFSGVGDYAITVTLGSNPNYNVTKTNGNLHISPKDASVSADNKAKQYGDDNPALTATVLGEVAGGDAINYTLVTGALKLSGVGDYAITVTLGSNPNYNVTKTNGNLHISPKDASVTADDQNKTYGDDNPALTASVVGQVPGGDIINYTLATTALKFSNVGNYTITVTLGSNPNYNVTKTNGTLHINSKDASVTAENKGKTYGDDNPALTAIVTGTVNGDTLNYTLSTAALKFSGVGDYAITVTLGSNPNYNVSKTDGNLHISPKNASVTADNKGKTYGDDNPAFTATLAGQVVGGDSINYTLATTALKFSGVGDYTITVTLGSNPNYNVTKTDGNLHISPKNASVTADNKSKTYGDVNPALTATVTGTVNNDVLNYTLSTTAIQFSNVANYPITVTLGSNPNYNVTPTNGTLTVNKANQTITWANPANVTVGTPLSGAQLNATVAGVTGGSAPGALTYTPPAGTVLGVGANQALQVDAAATSNYNAATKTVHINVNYTFVGFLQPIDNLPTLNSAKAGQTIPIKWQLKDASGNLISDLGSLAQNGLTSGSVACGSAPQDVIEELAAPGSTVFRFDGTQFIYNWQTTKSWAGSCRTLQVRLSDGTSYYAQFTFK